MAPEPPPLGMPKSERVAINSAEDWRRVVESLGLQGMAYQLAINSVLTSREGNIMHLSLASQHSTLRIPPMEKKLQEGLQQALGQPVVLNYSLGAEVAAQDTPAAMQQREARDRHAAAVQAMHADPIVRRICETFDGRVLEDSVQPIN